MFTYIQDELGDCWPPWGLPAVWTQTDFPSSPPYEQLWIYVQAATQTDKQS